MSKNIVEFIIKMMNYINFGVENAWVKLMYRIFGDNYELREKVCHKGYQVFWFIDKAIMHGILVPLSRVSKTAKGIACYQHGCRYCEDSVHCENAYNGDGCPSWIIDRRIDEQLQDYGPFESYM